MRFITTVAAVLGLSASQPARTEPIGPATSCSETIAEDAKAGRDLNIQSDIQKTVDPKLLAELAAALSSKDHKEWAAALAALAKWLPAKKGDVAEFAPVVAPLFALAGWGGKARQDARAAEDLLVRIGSPALPLLKDKLESEDAHDRRVAAELLVRIGPPDRSLATLLRPLLTDPDGYVRKAAIEGLGVVGRPAKDAINELEWLAMNEPYIPRRVAARIALIHVAGASEVRVRELADFLELTEPCDNANVYAASALAKLGPKARAAEPRLLAALKHPDNGVRINAAAALGQVGANSPEVIAALIDLLKSDPERETRRAAAGALGEIGPKAKAAVPALGAALKGDRQGGWWVAADALGKIGGADVVPVLVEALSSPIEDNRYASMKALGNLGAVARSAVMALEKSGQQDARAHLRAAAAEALRKIERAVNKMN